MSIVDTISDKRRHQTLVNEADTQIKERAFELGIRNRTVDSVFDLIDYTWKFVGTSVHIDWDGTGDYQELDMCITEYTNEGPVFIFSVYDCNLAGNLAEDAIVLLNGRNIVGELNVKSKINTRACA